MLGSARVAVANAGQGGSTGGGGTGGSAAGGGGGGGSIAADCAVSGKPVSATAETLIGVDESAGACKSLHGPV